MIFFRNRATRFRRLRYPEVIFFEDPWSHPTKKSISCTERKQTHTIIHVWYYICLYLTERESNMRFTGSRPATWETKLNGRCREKVGDTTYRDQSLHYIWWSDVVCTGMYTVYNIGTYIIIIHLKIIYNHVYIIIHMYIWKVESLIAETACNLAFDGFWALVEFFCVYGTDPLWSCWGSISDAQRMFGKR